MHQVVISIGYGVVTAAILALGAVGFTLQFGVTNLFNLAFGEVMTLSAFIAYVVHITAGANIWVALLAGGAAGAVASLAISRLIYLPFMRRGASAHVMVIVTVGVAIIVRNLMLMKASETFYGYRLPPQRSYHVLGMFFSPRQIAIIGIAAVSLLALHALFKFTRVGKAMRATSDDASLARTCGIPTGRVVNIAWLTSGLLCGLAGVALAIDLGTFDTTTGQSFLLIIVAAAVFGSVGEPYGAMVGALVIGISSEIAAIWIPNLKSVVAFALLVVMLLVRPQGLFGGRVQMRGDVLV
ncbi:MAG TPA: branched-chain amino acid ABC transporter permease [Gaiellaceae bacterium]|nr:branched-chain amino acid ABC transporter permease [Gaiellaceae bacterium]